MSGRRAVIVGAGGFAFAAVSVAGYALVGMDQSGDGEDEAGTPTPSPPPVEVGTWVDRIISSVDEERRESGLPGLERHAGLDGMCRHHAKLMASSGEAVVDGPEGSTLADRYSMFGLAAEMSDEARSLVAEGAGHAGSSSSSPPESVVSRWADSPDPWLLEPAWRFVGAGAAHGDRGTTWVSCSFL